MQDYQDMYQSTQINLDKHQHENDDGDEYQLAQPGSRIAAYAINSVLTVLGVFLILWGVADMSGGWRYLIDDVTEPELTTFGVSLMILGFVFLLVLAIVQIIYMTTRGQSLGKMVMNIKVINQSGENPGFLGVVFMREMVPGIILMFLSFIPVLGEYIDLVFWIVCFVMLFLTSRDRQTLQDLIAKTYVVNA